MKRREGREQDFGAAFKRGRILVSFSSRATNVTAEPEHLLVCPAAEAGVRGRGMKRSHEEAFAWREDCLRLIEEHRPLLIAFDLDYTVRACC